METLQQHSDEVAVHPNQSDLTSAKYEDHHPHQTGGSQREGGLPNVEGNQQRTEQQRNPSATQNMVPLKTSYNILMVLLVSNWALVVTSVVTVFLGNSYTRPVLNRLYFFLYCFSVHGVYLLWVLKVEQVQNTACQIFLKIKVSIVSLVENLN